MEHNKLAIGLLKFLENLKIDSSIGNWNYLGKTTDAFGTPGGSWQGEDGFKFQNNKKTKEYILRSIPSNKSILVIESYQIPGQLYNMQLTNIQVYKNDSDFGQLFESYNLTAGLGRVKKVVVKEMFDRLGFTDNLIFKINNLNPDWKELTKSILDWAPIREEVKNKIKEEINNENMTSPNIKTIDLNGAGLYKISHGSFKANKNKHVIESLKQNNWITIHESTGKGRGDKFKNNLKNGDYVYITLGGDELIGIAKIISNKCEYIPKEIINNEEGWLFREIEMIQEPIKKGAIQLDDTRAIYPSGNTSFFKVKSKDLNEANQLLFVPYFNVEFIDGRNTTPTTSYTNTKYMDSPLNQILFGPPGTGKTYHTINKALSIVEDVIDTDLKKETRFDLTTRFDDLLINDWENPSGQIAFVTFHQSMTYEDFIEGIKPVVTSKNKVIYETLPGIFKNMCTLAKENWLNANSAEEDELSFDDAFNSLKENWEEDKDMKFPMKTEGKEYTIIGFTKSSIQFKKASGSIDHTLSISTLRDYFYDRRKVRTTGVGIYYPAILKKLKSFQPTEFEVKEEKKYVLVIDEINRGNVSQIFGELITLIEEDKRLGNDESLEVTLPYSKESFGVPPNLYIIGTMNTADRSVEALDTALRRRFSFEEMPPDYSLSQLDYTIYNYNASRLLKTINNRIEKLLDKDHTIGHSYFIVEDGKNEVEEILKAFYKNIIPLLQEYFFGDFGKIGLVLGKGFVNKKEWNKNTEAFADFDHESSSDFEERDIYEIIDYRNSNHNYKIGDVEMSFDKAIQLLMKGSIA
ncbi:AAA domain (dynein-related subfamily) [Bizionia echini]|uniref:AAA domain (Dynein-related subfamily) n=1 Tax=Bizionia echini TaxID=649333 RepID=A0A1I5AFR9_9FLAO|nr:AAA family ATPase [Bizionia echini]SFN61288.1 AAA domain (dynein-related subfamily) [Bizionia echini]